MNTIETDIEKVLVTEAQIKASVDRIADAVARDYEDKDPIFVGVLRGSFVFFADLMKACHIPSQLDFISASSYQNGTQSSGVVKINFDISTDVKDRHVILVEDILDSGNTLFNLKSHFMDLGALSVKLCVLLDKPSRRTKPITADYCGFEIPDEFAVGYGLDYAERYRNLNYIGILKREVYEKK